MNTSGSPSLEIKNKIFQQIARRAIARNDYKLGIASAKMGQKINCLCNNSIILEGICHHQIGKYGKSILLFRKALDNASGIEEKQEIYSLMQEYDIPSDDDFFHCLQEAHLSIRTKKIIKSSFVIITLILLFIMIKFILF
ncbi:hypothetical protein [Solidesulfovibrio alcoholivorans]|uniref:hypothetical protein n=1 Tax=Solidesulfovibrio alcoholivorans TaxID=81406 RepID=UPI0012EC4461|nr:hypothetical protein [Solidesulfovibrio alcoholivorans]